MNTMKRHRLLAASIGLGLSREDNEEAAPAEVAVVEPSEKADETVADAVIDVTEASDNVEKSQEVVEELEDAAATLESIYLTIESSIEEGGLQPQAAAAIANHIEDTAERVGLPVEEVVPSTESFGGATDRLNATKLTLESLSEKIASVWQAIKNAFWTLMKKISDFFASIFVGVAKLKAHAEALKKKAADMSAGEGKEITVRGIGKLQTAGKADAKDFIAGLTNLDKVLKVAFGEYLKVNEEAMGVQVAVVKEAWEAGGDQAKLEALQKKVEEKIDALKSPFKGSKDVISGGYVVRAGADLKDGEKNAGSFSGTLTATIQIADKEAKSFDEVQKMPALGKGDVDKLLDATIAVLTTIEGEKSAIKASKEKREKAVKELDTVVMKVDGKEVKMPAIFKGLVGLTMRGFRRNYMDVVTRLSTIGFSASRSALVVAEKSIAVATAKPAAAAA